MKFILLLFSTLTALRLFAGDGDWPQFRGPTSSGTAPNATIPDVPKIDWSVPLPGRGLSSPIIVGEKLFVTCASGPRQETLQLLCLNAADGQKLWDRQLKATGRTTSHPKTSIASCTPCSDGRERVFAMWSCNDVAAFDLDGQLLWLRALTVDYPNASNSLGMASSPIVIGETLVVMIENDSESYALGLDVKTGRNLWKLNRPKVANWTSPVAWQADPAAGPVAVLQSGEGVIGVDPASGSQLWDYPNGASTMSSPVVADGVIFTPSNGLTALVPGGSGGAPEILWQARQLNPSTISPLALGGRIYSINGAGVIATADAKTGETGWKLRLKGPFSSSPVGAKNRLLVVNETGLVQVVEIAGEEGKAAATLQLPLKAEAKELILSTPSLSGDHVFIRGDSTLWRLGP
ncbi:MAG: PQQ-binding-like beta-propeller repeat protein [Chthoniobacteraceae bacterium]